MDDVVQVAAVEEHPTRSGARRFVVRDDRGKEYTTFRERIGEAAAGLEGRRVRIEYHEEERGRFTSVYLDKIEPAPEPPGGGAGEGGGRDADEVAWRTAVEAAPYLLSDADRKGEVAPEDLYERLEPFKELVAEDIRGDGDEEPEGG